MAPKKDKRSSDAKKNKDSDVNREDDEESRSSAFTPIPPRSIYGQQQQLHHPIAPRVRWPPLQEQTEPNETRSDKRPTEEPIVKENLVKRLVGQLDPAKSTYKSEDQKMKSSSSTSFHPIQSASNYSAAKPPPAPRHETEYERQQSVKSIIEKLQPADNKPKAPPLSKSVSSGFKPSKPQRQQPLQFREIEPVVFHKPPVATFSGYKSNWSLNKPPPQEPQLVGKKPSEENLHPRKVVYNSYQEAVRAIETNISSTDLDYESRVEEAKKEYKRQSQLSFESDTEKTKSHETLIENDFWKEETQKTNSLEEFEALERTLELQDPDFDFDKRVAQSIREHKIKQEKSKGTFPQARKMQKNELQEVFRERSKSSSHTDIGNLDYESRVEEAIKKYRSQSQINSDLEERQIARQEAALRELSISDSDFEQHVQESISNYKLNRQQQKSQSVISQKPKESQERSETELDYEKLVDESIRTHKLRQQQQSQEELNPKKSELEEIFEAKERSKSSSHMGKYDQESTIGNRKDPNKATKNIQSKLSSEAMQEFKKRQFSSSSEIQQIEEIQDSDIDKRIEESIRANRQKQQQEAIFQRSKALKNEPLETSFQAKNISTSQQKIPTISKVQKIEDQNIMPRSHLITELDNEETPRIQAPRIIPRPKEVAETRRPEVTRRRNPQLSIDIQNVHKSRIGWQNPKSNFIFDLIVSQNQRNEREEFRKMVSFFVLNKLNDIFSPPLITKSQQFVSFYRLAGAVDLHDSIDKVLVCASIALRDLLASYFLHMKFIVIVTAYDRISRNEPTFADKCFWDSELDERVCVVHYGDHISCVVHVYAINND